MHLSLMATDKQSPPLLLVNPLTILDKPITCQQFQNFLYISPYSTWFFIRIGCPYPLHDTVGLVSIPAQGPDETRRGIHLEELTGIGITDDRYPVHHIPDHVRTVSNHAP